MIFLLARVDLLHVILSVLDDDFVGLAVKSEYN